MSDSAQLACVIHVIDDDDAVRKAVMRLLSAVGYDVRGYSTSGEFLLTQPNTEPGCVVLDVQMPGPSGLQIQESINKQVNPLPIVFLTGHGDIPMSVRAMKAGAVDFLTKPVQRAELLSAVEAALAHDTKIRADRKKTIHVQKCFETLTDREREIFAMVVKGKLNKHIATALGIAERTVKAHRANVMTKMQVTSLAELVRLAADLQLESA